MLVGKGITFDSGGLSLKPNDGMKLMKTDMAGGAAVIAVMSALAGLGVTRPGHRPDRARRRTSRPDRRYRPGDVITHFGGRTVEVLNTDAEGRLVLADALAYADAVLEPDADRRPRHADRRGPDRARHLASAPSTRPTTSWPPALTAAGPASGDRLWRMPLVEDYTDALDSPVADLAHVARRQNGRDRAGRVDRGRAVPARVHRRPAVGPPGHRRAPPGPAATTARSPRARTGFGTRLLLRWLTAAVAAADRPARR